VSAKRVPDHLAETVEKLAQLHAATEENVTRRQRSVETVARHLGHPLTTYAMACGVLAWVGLNVALVATDRTPIDAPPFPLLQCACTVAALLVTTVILSAQNRQRSISDERMQLDLQINLMAERKIAKIIALVEELRRDLPNVANRRDSMAEAMTEAIDPGAVVSALRETLESPPSGDAEPEAPAGSPSHEEPDSKRRESTGEE
jgi:uncharacterized membrane protein